SYVESLLIISRKLLRISFALLQKNTPFDASFPLFSGLLPLTGIPTDGKERRNPLHPKTIQGISPFRSPRRTPVEMTKRGETFFLYHFIFLSP
ncbi:hypothetical protein K9L63_03830, partial [Candidatus Gracilibacteria bacterium]|nr:hypothetical protein [Candidatus Gracilibacteria bacterium]